MGRPASCFESYPVQLRPTNFGSLAARRRCVILEYSIKHPSCGSLFPGLSWIDLHIPALFIRRNRCSNRRPSSRKNPPAPNSMDKPGTSRMQLPWTIPVSTPPTAKRNKLCRSPAPETLVHFPESRRTRPVLNGGGRVLEGRGEGDRNRLRKRTHSPKLPTTADTASKPMVTGDEHYRVRVDTYT
jgi:hypothetical protein